MELNGRGGEGDDETIPTLLFSFGGCAIKGGGGVVHLGWKRAL